MEWPTKCPGCLSKFPDIRGMIFPAGGGTDGHRCEHDWHKGQEGYDPSKLNLTDSDRVFLAEQKIKF